MSLDALMKCSTKGSMDLSKFSFSTKLSEEQKARIGTEYVHSKSHQRKHQFIGGKERIGFRDNRLNRRGSVVSSSSMLKKTDDGSEVLCVVAKREYEHYDGSIREAIDYDVTIRKVGSDLELLRKTCSVVEFENTGICLHCLTSAFIRKVRRNKQRGSDVAFLQCTRCDRTSKGL